MSREARLEALGFPLDRIPTPGAIYRPVTISGNLAYVSGCVPFDGPGNLAGAGKVGRDVTLEEAQRHAALCAANVLRLLREELGSLDRIAKVVRVGGYVNSTETFSDQHLVINGASQLFIDVLGREAGLHARTALGLAQLPLGSSVEVDAIVEILPA
ncbi:MAG TPA: RidA family protein [Polyangiaceae bacterium]|nr:RidA family protein [Polyangiaceae bacterium]